MLVDLLTLSHNRNSYLHVIKQNSSICEELRPMKLFFFFFEERSFIADIENGVAHGDNKKFPVS